MLEQLQTVYGDDLRVVYRHFPLTSIHANATLSAVAAEAAGNQDAFWEYHDLLFEKQAEWANQSGDTFVATLVSYAEELGLDTKQFAADLEDESLTTKVNEAETEAREAGLTGTPTILLNGYPFPTQQIPLSPQGIDFFMGIVRLVETQYDQPEQVIDPDKDYQVTVTTEQGEIVFDLFPDTAPVNVNSFAFLAENGWYDGVTFHRVLPGFMAQGGDPSGVGVGWPGYRCDDEVSAEHNFAEAGMVAMANSGPNTNGAQFFITSGPAPHLDADFTIIGEVVSGQEYVEALTPRDPDQSPNFEGDKIISVVVTEK